ncbi:hypothetical protein [Fibrella forsythiae]|uniref:CN hydrolase domain-containing protein n=1 Tax=Fibrella forsythiae TaxID=2817061 RepID=A0ABS3JCZ5_9BACT|nr:hypothetical protein [Fibrella forsythiae]MBO0947129.1 hypothetical protein [Fibrella forsythiae]
MARLLNISLRSEAWQHMADSLTDRISILKRLCNESFVQSSIDANPLHIVVVPEYFFRKTPAQVVTQLNDTFHGYRGPANEANRLTQGQLALFNGQKRKHTLYSQQEKDLLVASLRALTAGTNTLIVAGTTFWVEREPVIRAATFFRAQQITKGIARNSCFMVHNGVLMATYHKNVDREELDTYEQNLFTFMPGTSAAAVVIDGIHIGVEICADHGHRDLIQRVETGTLARLDVHIIISDGASPLASNVGTHANGLVIHCDTSSSQIIQLARNAMGMAVRTVICPMARTVKRSVVFDTAAAPGSLHGPVMPT